MEPFITLLRPDDLLSLVIEVRNLKLVTSDPANPKLVVDKAGTPAYLLVHFPPQHIQEKAYFQLSKKVTQNPGFNVGAAPPPALTDPLDPPGKVPYRMSAGSSLVFKVPAAVKSIPYTFAGLLDWSKLEPVVSPAALGRTAPTLLPPTDLQTAIELPYGLILSPQDDAGWTHSTEPEVFNSRVALWHTRLGSWKKTTKNGVTTRSFTEASEKNEVPFRAIWTNGFDDHGLIPPFGTETPFRTSLSPHDLPQLVVLTSGTNGYFVPVGRDGRDPFFPKPAQASRMFLSALGGWLTSRGSWGAPPSYFAKDGSLQSLDITEWSHLATQGRDQHVQVVYEGFLFPFGHRASLVKVTERKIELPSVEAPSSTAYLRQHMYVVVREFEKSYADAPFLNDKREMPFWQSIHINTKVTPDIDMPEMLTGDGLPHDSFWIRVGGDGFNFHVTGKDLAGKRIDFLSKMIFMSQAESFPSFVQIAFAGGGDQRLCLVQGQKVTYADPTQGDTTLRTSALMFNAEILQTQPPFTEAPFIPILTQASISVPSLEHLLGVTTPVDIGWYTGYLQKGLDLKAGVFAEVLTPQPIAFSADKAGGLATPKLTLKALSARKGLVAGNPDDAAGGNIRPSDFFGDVTAQLFGTIPLGQLIPVNNLVADAAKNSPEIRTILHPNSKAPETIVTKLTWSPELQPYDNPPVKLVFDNNKKSELNLKVRLTRSLVGAPPTSEAVGELTYFIVSLADVIGVQIDSLKFTSVNGAKSTVEAKLHSKDPVEFLGPLSFVQTLVDILPANIFGGSGVKIQLEPKFIRATLTIGLPTIACGVFSLEHISFLAGIDLPYLDGKPALEFGFASRSNPFLITVEVFGGGGFIHLIIDTDGVQLVEGALEFGGHFAFDIGVASGGVHVIAGIYFAIKRTGTTVTGFLDIGGEVSILGIISISLDLNLSLSYDSATQKITGKATLSVSIHIIFFSISVSVSVEKSFGSNGGDPRLRDLMPDTAWAEYANAFA